MSLHVIELSDHNICIANAEGILGFEPGFANIAHTAPLFGHEAQQQSRLHPQQSFNQFWSQLNLDPLINSNEHFRHQADLAYAHLNNLARAHSIEGDVIFAVPSNYNRDQLAILLGLVKQCSFNAVGLVDLAVLKTSHLEANQPALFIDIQLHQTVLTNLEQANGHLTKGAVQQIPGVGLMALYDAWANMVTDEFISQSRFDPQHNAETEQYVYNQLNSWLAQVSQKKELLLEINNRGSIHQAKLNLSYFEQRAHNIITRIAKEIQSLASPDTKLILSSTLATLPGFSSLENLIALEQEQAINNCFSNLEHIAREPDAINLITSLPLKIDAAENQTQPKAESFSHILVNEQAYPLPSGDILIGVAASNLIEEEGALFIELVEPSLKSLITFSNEKGRFILQNSSGLKLNSQAIEKPTAICLGDSISLEGSPLSLKFIKVS